MVDIFDLKIGETITVSIVRDVDRRRVISNVFRVEFRLPWWNQYDVFYISKKEHFITTAFYYLFSTSKRCYFSGTNNSQQREMIKEIIKLSPFNTVW